MLRNTKVHYRYRDADNYKQHCTEIIAGSLSTEQIDTIRNCLDSREYFIPFQVGLPEIRFAHRTEADHAWFELMYFEPTGEAPTVNITADRFYQRFLTIAEGEGWNCTYWEQLPAQHKCSECGRLLTEGLDKIHKGLFASKEQCWCEACDSKLFV